MERKAARTLLVLADELMENVTATDRMASDYASTTYTEGLEAFAAGDYSGAVTSFTFLINMLSR